jgi:hypothetical protein
LAAEVESVVAEEAGATVRLSAVEAEPAMSVLPA